MLTGAATVFVVEDIEASLHHYRHALGFDVAFEYGRPVFYAGLCRDEVELHLIAARRTSRRPGQGAIAVFVEDVDGLYGELTARGARAPKPPRDYPYGMRDFNVVDPDGNQLTFGMATEPAGD